jgi:NDP-sugar pyrophosphorylase family protein
MKAIIHCGGKGTRLAEISKTIPKPMVKINGKPLLEYHIENLKKTGVINICITLHHLPKVIMDYFGNGERYGVNILYSVEPLMLGTGGALSPIKEFVKDDTLIVYGDVVSFVDYRKMLSFHKRKKALITAATHPSSHPEDSDLVTFDKSFKMLSISRKPHKIIPLSPQNLSALYIVNPKIKKYLDIPKPFDIAHDLLPLLLERKEKVFCYNTSEFMMDIGTPERLHKAHELLKNDNF